jgi:uncharacterized protein
MSQATADAQTQTATRPVRIVDCDVHPELKSRDEFLAYLAEPWRSMKLPWEGRRVVVAPDGGRRADALPPGGGPSASDPAFMEQQLFGDAGVDIAVMIPISLYPWGFHPGSPEEEAAISAAYNEWQADTWIGKYNWHGRYRSSILLPVHNPTAARAEIEKWAGHPYFVQALVPHIAPNAFGHPTYDIVWEAAARHGLPIAVHVASGPGDNIASPVGVLRHFIEFKSVTYPMASAAHLLSMLANGTFERHEGLKLVLVEGGISWAYALVSRLNHLLQPAGASVAGALKDRVFFTTQPIEEPADPSMLVDVIAKLGPTQLLFSTDYPHFDFDDPKRALAAIPKTWHEAILAGNARALYSLPAELAVPAG